MLQLVQKTQNYSEMVYVTILPTMPNVVMMVGIAVNQLVLEMDVDLGDTIVLILPHKQ